MIFIHLRYDMLHTFLEKNPKLLISQVLVLNLDLILSYLFHGTTNDTEKI